MRKKVILMVGLLISFGLCGSIGNANETVSNTAFFHFAPGTQYVCFVDESETSIQFKNILEEVSSSFGWEISYFDVRASEQDSGLEEVLRRYHIEKYPTIIQMFDSDLRDSYTWDPELSKNETVRELERFLIERGLNPFSVTDGNVPIQFSSSFHAFSFFIMAVIFLYLLLERKKLMRNCTEAESLFLIIFMTVLIWLHIREAVFGFKFSLQAEAIPSSNILAQIGAKTWLIITPLLYLVNLVLCIRLGWFIRKL